MDISNKIITSSNADKILGEIKNRGLTIGLCHGCFDIVHYGHIRHFEAAKKKCDILIVSITSDDFIKKKRYFRFSNSIRVNQLINQRLIDYVLIVEDESALPAIELLKPNFYFKGDEYQNLLSDSSKNIIKEKEIVEKYNGNIIFTQEETFSTLKLGYSLRYESEAEATDFNDNIEYIDASEYNINLKRIKELISKIASLKALVIGEVIEDEWIVYTNEFLSPKSKCISGKISHVEKQTGGANNIFIMLKNFGVDVSFITNKIVIDSDNSIYSLGIGEIKKTRFCSDNLQKNPTFQIQEIKSQTAQNVKNERINELISENNILLLADYDHGLRQELIRISEDKIFTKITNEKIFSFGQANSNNKLVSPLANHNHRGTVILNLNEAKSLLGNSFGKNYSLILLKLKDEFSWTEIILTLGEEGVIGIDKDLHIVNMKPIAKTLNKNINLVGSGDSFFSMYSLVRSVGGSMLEAFALGQIAATINLGRVGTELIPTPQKIIETSKIVLMK